MRYRDPNLSEQLAAEYVLGTLKGRARKRFERLLQRYPHLQQEVEQWELALNRLGEQVTPVEPPVRVWRGLEQTLFGHQSKPIGWYERIALWRGLTVASSLLAAMLAIMLLVVPPAPKTTYVLLLNNNAQQVAWSMSTPTDMEEFYVQNLKPMEMPENQGCLLWLQPAGSNEAYMLGRLPDDGGKLVLPIDEPLRSMLLNGTFMVTIEDMNKPMPATPTHPTQFTGRLIPTTSI